MTREEIENLSAVEPYYFETDIEKRWYEIGYINGLRDADTEPNLKKFWHDASEEPQEDGWILVQFSTDVYDTLALPRDVDVLRDFIEMRNFARWAYISDLLPKGDRK